MRPIGIIANPASGKDIRRLVAYGSVFDNHEKVNIVRRVVLGLESMGVEEVVFMPDHFNIGSRAMEDLSVSMKHAFLDMPMEGSQEDSTRAASMFNDMGAACIVTLGGDGTNRAVAKACKGTPLLPISTGTNNVFPFMVEGTMAGIAAGVVASGAFPSEKLAFRAPCLEIMKDSEVVDLALIDVVVSEAAFIATRALWDVAPLKEIFLCRAEPGNIGFSSVGGHLCALPPGSGKGVHIKIGDGRNVVKAPIAPGLVRNIPIEAYEIFERGRSIPISHAPGVIAMDGERERLIKKGEVFSVRHSANGPMVVDMGRTLRMASEASLFCV